MRIIFICFLFTLSLLIGCNRDIECKGIKDNQYSGYAIVFYHKPVSGSMIEVTIVPSCGDTLNLKNLSERSFKDIKLLRAVSYRVGIRDSLFANVFMKSRKIVLLNNQTLASELRNVYACPVYIEFDGAQDITEATVNNMQNNLHEKLVFDDSLQIVIEYFLSSKLRIAALRVL